MDGWRPGMLVRFAVLLGGPPELLTSVPRRSTEPFWGPLLRRAALLFVPIAVAVTAGVWLTFAATWGLSYRTAFEPQTQLAADAAVRLDAGETPSAVLPSYRVDAGVSAYPYLVVTDPFGQVLASSADLDGAPLALPAGLLDYASTGVERSQPDWYAVYAGPAPWVMWTPRSGATSALVVQRWSGGYVVAGRSAEPPTGEFALIWTLTLLATAAICLMIGLVHPMPSRPPPPPDDGGPDRDPEPRPHPRERRPLGFRPLLRPRRRSRPRSRR